MSNEHSRDSSPAGRAVYDVCNDYTLEPSAQTVETVRALSGYRWRRVQHVSLDRVEDGPLGLVRNYDKGLPAVDLGYLAGELHYAIGPAH